VTQEPSIEITRLPEKGSTNRAELDALLDEAYIAHVGLVVDGHPLVIPTAVARDEDRLLVHGSTGSGWMRVLADGAPACVTVTLLEGLVVARSAFESSMHYRSAVVFGSFTPVSVAEKLRALNLLTDVLIPGRRDEVRAPTARELSATLVLAMPIERWSLKISAKWPEDPDEDVEGDAWAGVVPMRVRYDTPMSAPDLRAGIAVPNSVNQLNA